MKDKDKSADFDPVDGYAQSVRSHTYSFKLNNLSIKLNK